MSNEIHYKTYEEMYHDSERLNIEAREKLFHQTQENHILKDRLANAVEVIKFYADEANWRDIIEEESYGNNCGLERGCFDSIIYEDCSKDVGGKRAREFLTEYL